MGPIRIGGRRAITRPISRPGTSTGTSMGTRMRGTMRGAARGIRGTIRGAARGITRGTTRIGSAIGGAATGTTGTTGATGRTGPTGGRPMGPRVVIRCRGDRISATTIRRHIGTRFITRKRGTNFVEGLGVCVGPRRCSTCCIVGSGFSNHMSLF